MIPLIQDAERYRQGMGWTLGSGWCEIACGTCSVCNTARPCEVAANSRAGVRWVPVRRGSAGAKGLKEDYDTGGERTCCQPRSFHTEAGDSGPRYLCVSYLEQNPRGAEQPLAAERRCGTGSTPMVKQASEVATDEEAMLQVCGSESMVEKVKALWADMMEKKRLDVSDQGLSDDDVARLLKGLHMCAPTA